METPNTQEDTVTAAIRGAETFQDRVERQWNHVRARMDDECGALTDVLTRAESGLAPRIAEAVTMMDFAAVVRAFDDALAEVRDTMTYERASGRLKQYSSFDRVNQWKSELACFGYGAAAKSVLVDELVKADDEIVDVDYLLIKLKSGRSITRLNIRDNCRPELLSSLESDEKIHRMREDAAEVAAKRERASRSSGTGITDGRGHFREFGA